MKITMFILVLITLTISGCTSDRGQPILPQGYYSIAPQSPSVSRHRLNIYSDGQTKVSLKMANGLKSSARLHTRDGAVYVVMSYMADDPAVFRVSHDGTNYNLIFGSPCDIQLWRMAGDGQLLKLNGDAEQSDAEATSEAAPVPGTASEAPHP